MESGLKGSETVVLEHVKKSLVNVEMSDGLNVIVVRMERTVFPALSRPRNKSFAPGWALVERFDPGE